MNEGGQPTHSPAGWRYPQTWSDRFSRRSRQALRAGLAVMGAGSLALLVLWGVPTLVLLRSPAWAAAREAVERDPEVRAYLGGPLQPARLPREWELSTEGGRFRMLVDGPGGRMEVVVVVEGGRRAQVRVARLVF